MMKTLKISISIFTFIEINLLFILTFLVSNYVIFNGEEKSGTLVTIITLIFFVLSIFFSVIVARKIYRYLNAKTSKINYIDLLMILTIITGTMSLINIFSYILLVE